MLNPEYSYYKYSGLVASHGQWGCKPVTMETTAKSRCQAANNIRYRLSKQCNVPVAAIAIEPDKLVKLN